MNTVRHIVAITDPKIITICGQRLEWGDYWIHIMYYPSHAKGFINACPDCVNHESMVLHQLNRVTL